MMNCVKISGGVRNAAMIKMKKIAYFLFLERNTGVTIPNFVRNNMTKGNSNMSPKSKISDNTKDMYLLIVIIGVKSLLMFKRKYNPIGIRIKYANAIPIKNNSNNIGR